MGNKSLDDNVIIGFIIWGELKSISNVPVPWGEALEALSYQYSSSGFHFTSNYALETCRGHCDTIEKELRWLNEFEAFYNGDANLLTTSWQSYQSSAQIIKNAPPSADANKGSYLGPIDRNSHVWGNYYVGANSLMETYILNSGWNEQTSTDAGLDKRREYAPWWDLPGPPLQASYSLSGFVVFSGEQNRVCKNWSPSCIGWRR